ncbi:hypothetical protein BLNAU_2448 [Blattamonas nauphoetae]|uniref:Uncharacterized protein n=1 Tax=Blattamonas nauphoetae TaxID=2049346 RepID=A0ABQ9YG28_9EUKA|nr:hypothetical protein BLNAU_2448 [Blattamonas nauphoetae]
MQTSLENLTNNLSLLANQCTAAEDFLKRKLQLVEGQWKILDVPYHVSTTQSSAFLNEQRKQIGDWINDEKEKYIKHKQTVLDKIALIDTLRPGDESREFYDACESIEMTIENTDTLINKTFKNFNDLLLPSQNTQLIQTDPTKPFKGMPHVNIEAPRLNTQTMGHPRTADQLSPLSFRQGIPMMLPTSFPPQSNLCSFITPPLVQFSLVIEKFLELPPSTHSFTSPLMSCVPFPFKWQLTIYPTGIRGEIQQDVTLEVVMDEGFSQNKLKQAKTIFPYVEPHEAVSKTSDSALAFAQKAEAYCHPHHFGVVVEMIRQRGDSQNGTLLKSSIASTWATFRPGVPVRMDQKFNKTTVRDSFLWDDGSAHFIFGVRFPCYKRMAEAYHLSALEEQQFGYDEM